MKKALLQPVTNGARALRAYIDAAGISVPTFCEQHQLDRIMVQRAMNGDRKRISVDFALKIEAATKGAVKVAMWSTDTLALRSGKPAARRRVA